uniref:Chondroitin sulfate proteoglycan 4bb n=1 Tax=Labrus bergylta TaxID=56723 RepID=A0A3Q3N4U9_9LABR
MIYSCVGALSGGFQFQVNDGVNIAPRQIFSTTAHSLVLTLQRNRQMEVLPGSVTPISEQELKAVTNDVIDIRRNRSVVFAVTAPPKLGRLVQRLPDNSSLNISVFTQSMVQICVSLSIASADSFSFTVSSPPAFLPPHTFSILISYQANEHHDDSKYKTRLLNNAGAVVAEGGRVMIDRSKLDASNLLGKVPESYRKDHVIMYRVISLPRHGALSLRGHNLNRNKPDFSQVTLNKFGITYIHDDSETISDSFTFRAWVAPLDVSSWAVTETFNITVTPVNDQPPLLRSRNPSMKVVVGERVVLGPDNLQVEDHDTPPEELHYLVISKPDNGYLTLGERPEPVTSFTQYDVNHNRLHFIQQGEPSAGVFYFNVTDGHHRPLYKLFSLEVIKPSVSVVNNTGLSLVQGKTAVILTTNQLAAQTNGRSRANITYTVTAHPRHGRIAINDHEVTTFWHEDLLFGRVVYHMTELSESETASKSWCRHHLTVTVLPLIHLREQVRVPSGVAVKLGKAMMDASELARISRADPVFEVLSPPKHGKLVKVKFEVACHAPATPLNDSFTFLLKAGNVQPAKGELHFAIFPHHQMHHGPSGSNKAESANREHTNRLPTHNKTTPTEGRGVGQEDPTTQGRVRVGVSPRILSPKNQNRTQHKHRHHSRWGNHTRSESNGNRSGTSAEGAGEGHSPAPQPKTPSLTHKHGPADPPDTQPVHVEVLPRPSSDPLLIILPLLACLLLIVILIVLILVFRRRKEKQARQRLLQQLAAGTQLTQDSPCLGRTERSVAMPSVVVTPLASASCPTSPRVPITPRRRSLAPGMTFWGPFDAEGAGDDGNVGGDLMNSKERYNIPLRTAVPAVQADIRHLWEQGPLLHLLNATSTGFDRSISRKNCALEMYFWRELYKWHLCISLVICGTFDQP